MATAACSIALVALSSASFRRWPPGVLIPLAFIVSGALHWMEWALVDAAPAPIARLLYLHVSGLGPLLASGFWLIATDTFDPHSAKKHFARIGGAATFGGLMGAVLAERIAVWVDESAILLAVGMLSFACAWQIRRLAARTQPDLLRSAASPELSAVSARSGLRVLTSVPYLRDLGALVLFGAIAAALVEYAFRVEAVRALGRADSLLQFFVAYYAAVSLATFMIQVVASQPILEKLGLTAATASPAAAVIAGSTGALLFPGLAAATMTRGSESALRGSLFRAGYEILYTPCAPADRRAAKSSIDVVCDRMGEAIGGALVTVAQATAVSLLPTILGLAIGCSALALALAARLRRGYVRTLAQSLVDRAVEIDLRDVEDATTRTAFMRALPAEQRVVSAARDASTFSNPARDAAQTAREPEIQTIMELRSGDRTRVLRVLETEELPASLTPHIVPLLAWDEVAEQAGQALRAVAEERIGQLTDVLLDRNQPFAIRRRLARVFSVCVSQRAADGLLAALDDLRFEVRYHCGRSLIAIRERNPRVRIDSERVFAVIDREVGVSATVWAARQLLDAIDVTQPRSPVDDFVTLRANQSLAHVFTLLSLVLPAEPLHVAFRGLHINDPRLRGTALEYLEHVLPAPLRYRLWPFLDAPPAPSTPIRSREEVLADLMRQNPSVGIHLDQLRALLPPPEQQP